MLKITVKWRDATKSLDVRNAGIVVQEGCLIIYPKPNEPDADFFPLDLISEINIRQDDPEENKVVPIRGSN